MISSYALELEVHNKTKGEGNWPPRGRITVNICTWCPHMLTLCELLQYPVLVCLKCIMEVSHTNNWWSALASGSGEMKIRSC